MAREEAFCKGAGVIVQVPVKAVCKLKTLCNLQAEAFYIMQEH